jgi:hypothetical protein
MADVPDQAVVRRIEDPVESNRQLDYAEARAQMAAGFRDGADHLIAKFRCNLRELIFRQLTQIVRRMNSIK